MFMVYVYKEDETITKKPVKLNKDSKKALAEYYEAAQDLCQAVEDGNIFPDIKDRYSFQKCR